MQNKEYLDSLIYRTKYYPDGTSDEIIKELYDEVQKVLNSNKYTKEEKEYLHDKAYLEMLAMML